MGRVVFVGVTTGTAQQQLAKRAVANAFISSNGQQGVDQQECQQNWCGPTNYLGRHSHCWRRSVTQRLQTRFHAVQGVGQVEKTRRIVIVQKLRWKSFVRQQSAPAELVVAYE